MRITLRDRPLNNLRLLIWRLSRWLCSTLSYQPSLRKSSSLKTTPLVLKTIWLSSGKSHDDIMTWIQFPHYRPFVCEGNPPVIDGFPLQRTSNVELWIFYVISLNFFNKKCSDRWMKHFDAYVTSPLWIDWIIENRELPWYQFCRC